MKHKKILTEVKIAFLKGYHDGYEIHEHSNPYGDSELCKHYNTGYDGGTFSWCLNDESLKIPEELTKLIEESEK
jgi:hypothetical protein